MIVPDTLSAFIAGMMLSSMVENVRVGDFWWAAAFAVFLALNLLGALT